MSKTSNPVGSFILLLLCLIPFSRTSAQPPPIVISDSEFGAGLASFTVSGWTLITTAAPPGLNVSPTLQRQIIGGTAGMFLELRSALPDHSPFSYVDARVLYTGQSYTPSTQGAISHLDFSYDFGAFDPSLLINPRINVLGLRYPLIIEQGGRTYRLVGNLDLPQYWQQYTRNGLTAQDFSLPANPDEHPDFSASGSAMRFGFWQQYRRDAGTPPSGRDLLVDEGLDNFRVVVNRSAIGPGGGVDLSATLATQPYFAEDVLDLTHLHHFTISYRNDSDSSATGVIVKLTGIRPHPFISPDPIWSSCSGAVCARSLGDVAAHASASFSFDNPLAPEADLDTFVSFTLTIADDGAQGKDLNPGNNSYTASAPITCACGNGNSRCCALESAYWCLLPLILPAKPLLADHPDGGFGQTLKALVLSQTGLNLNAYSRARDEILSLNATGLHYTDLYDTHSAEIRNLMLGDATLASQGLAVFQQWQVNLGALVDNLGGQVLITSGQIPAANAFLNNLSAKGSPALQQAISTELGKLPSLASFVGLSVDQWATQMGVKTPGVFSNSFE
ncbi:MAG: hypothetical protein U1F68_04770 [Gammaproteobacteria bacterium]